jgi:hypothetical protein
VVLLALELLNFDLRRMGLSDIAWGDLFRKGFGEIDLNA